MAIDSSICDAYPIAILGKNTKYSSKKPDFPQGVKNGNGLTSIEWCTLLGELISIGLGLLSLILKMLLNLVGCWVSIAHPRWYSDMYLAVVQHLKG